MSEPRYYDNSSLENFRRCHRMYYLRNVRDWTPEYTSHNLIFGLCWHSAMDVVWNLASSSKTDLEIMTDALVAFQEVWNKYYPGWKAEQESTLGTGQDELYPKTPGRAADMLVWYLKTRRHILAGYEILGIEVPFIVPLSYGQEDTSEIYYIGRNDKIIRKSDDKRVYIIDHKTTKSDGAAWVNTFQPNNQVDGYNYSGLMTYGDEFMGVQIDGALCQKGPKVSKDPSLPSGIGFPQHILRAATGFTQAWLWETTYTIMLLESHLKMLEDCKNEDEILKAFDKRTTACGYYSGCIYRNICAYITNPAREVEPPTGFKVEKWIPFEILDQTKLVASEGGE